MKHRYDPSSDSMGRRKLLRAGGAALAVAAGAGVVAAATPAQATDGQPLIQGQTNTGLDAGTTVRNNSSTLPSLAVGNASVVNDPGGGVAAGPQLRFEPLGDFVDGPQGTVGMASDGTLWTVADPGFQDFIRTSFNTTQLVGFTPVRMMDTRTAPGRVNIIKDPGDLDSLGRLVGGKTIGLNLDGLLIFGDVLFLNLTITGATANGYAAVFPWPIPWPKTSNINYRTGVTVANSAVCQIGSDGTYDNAISIYSNRTTHVVIDVTAATVSSPGDIIGASVAADLREQEQRLARRRRLTSKRNP
jgi:hypothetical protein